MIRKGAMLSLTAGILVVIIFVLLGFRFPDQNVKINPSVHEKKSQEVKIIAVREEIIKPPKPSKPIENKPEAKIKKPELKKAPAKSENKSLPDGRLKVDYDMIKQGIDLIKGKGKIPVVHTSDDQIGFDAYLQKMKEMGGRLFVGDAQDQTLIAEALVQKQNGRFKLDAIATSAFDVSGLAVFRPREIVNEALADEIIGRCKKIYGNRDLRCVLMLPLEVEAGILGGLKNYLLDNGYSVAAFDLVWGSYQQSGPDLHLKIQRGRIRDSKKTVQLDLDLSL